MKKYLMNGIWALAAVVFAASCTHDDDYGNANSIEQKTQNFQKAFKQAFGNKIDPNQTWGFRQTNVSDVVSANNTRSEIRRYTRGLLKEAGINDSIPELNDSIPTDTIPADTVEYIPVITTETIYSIDEEVKEAGRVFCEDLGNFTNKKDFDYNDVIFDATIITRTYKTTTKTYEDDVLVDELVTEDFVDDLTKIEVYAVGGTLNTTVAGIEVHDAFGVGKTTMVNTRDKNSSSLNGANTVARDPIRLKALSPISYPYPEDLRSEEEIAEDEYLFSGFHKILDIPVVVMYEDGSVLTLGSEPGEAPHMILVDKGARWPSERCAIDDAYPVFIPYVAGESATFWNGNNYDEDYLYDPEETISTEVVGDRSETVVSENNTLLHVLWTAKQEEGYDISIPIYFTDTNLLVNQNIQVGDRLRFDAQMTSDDWMFVLADGNSSRLYTDMTSLYLRNYIEISLTKELVDQLKANNANAAMMISGKNVLLKRVSLIKK